MQQGFVALFLTIILYASNLFGGGPPLQAPEDPLPAVTMGQRLMARTESTPLRVAPEGSATVVTEVQRRDLLIVIDSTPGWLKVRLSSGVSGWIPKYLTEVELETQAKSDWPRVVGFHRPNESAMESLIGNEAIITDVLLWGWQLHADGSITRDSHTTIHHPGKTHALIHVTQDPDTVANVLLAPKAQEQAVENMAKIAAEDGLKGIHLMLLNVRSNHREQLSAFVEGAAQRLAIDSVELSITVPAQTETDPDNAHSSGYNYERLGGAVDWLIVLAKDEHGAQDPPGPIASYPWTEMVIEYAVNRVERGKLVLALSPFGWNWSANEERQQLAYSEVLQLAAETNAAIRWHRTYRSPYFEHEQGQVWFENRYSWKHKLNLAKDHLLGGIALWGLGAEDHGSWRFIDEYQSTSDDRFSDTETS